MTTYQKVFQPVFDKLGLTITRAFREGPRFYVAGGEYQGEKVVFKADLESEKKPLTKAWFKLRREAAFLESGDLKHIPNFYAKGTHRGFFWLLQERVPGESQEQGESTFLIKDSFFTPKNLEYCLEFLTTLHNLPQTNQNPKFKEFEEKFAKKYTLADYVALIVSDRGELVGRKLTGRIDELIGRSHKFFDAQQTVITHHEFFAPHIFVNGGKLNVIDWENVGWGNPAYDFMELWIRSFAHPEFQAELLERFRAVHQDREVFDRLFALETVFQGLGNLKYFKAPEVAEERAVAGEVTAFLLKRIEQAVK
ncbi:MAG: hypothetical protein BMS9Abin34_009 [Patescibacteria group bacterium]|nr:MAG: hypothetical protein BMS9Abin34_009 [Patescibacteria group bacterium]